MGHVAFPDYSIETLNVIAEGNMVMTIARRTGTNTGVFLGLPPTGKVVRMFRMALFRLEDGKVAEMWAMDDWLGQFQQLELIGSSSEIIAAYKESHNLE